MDRSEAQFRKILAAGFPLPDCVMSLLNTIDELQAQLEDANGVIDSLTINYDKSDIELERENFNLKAQLDAVRKVFKYANRQADRAQIRLIKHSRDEADLYDDTFWQPVVDTIRFELQQSLGENDE